MQILSDIALDFVAIKGAAYPRINIIGLARPNEYHQDDFFVLEKYSIDRQDVHAVTNAQKAAKQQAILYYIAHSVYMSSYIHMGGFDLLRSPTVFDLREYIEKGIARLIDTETDTLRFLSIYRIYYKSHPDTGASSYCLGVEVGRPASDADAQLQYENGADIQRSLMRGYGTLYRTDSSGILIEKGVPMQHGAQRYRGPLEGAKERARRTALFASKEFLESSIDDVYETTKLLYQDVQEFGNRLVASSRGVGVRALTPIYDTIMNQFLFMGQEIYMQDENV